MDDWFRWVVGAILTAFGAFSGWVAHFLFTGRREMADLDKRLTVVERQMIDPIAYTRAITEQAAALSALTVQISALIETQARLMRKLEEIESELDSLAKYVRDE